MSWKRYLPVIFVIGGLALCFAGCRTNCGRCGPAPFHQPLLNQQPNFQQQNFQQPNFQQQNFQQPQLFNQQPFQNPQGFGSTSRAPAPVSSGSLSRSQLIPPPATGSLTIPSLARNNPFGVNQNRGLLNTNQAAPTAAAATRSARFNAQNGWHGVEGAQSGVQSPLTTRPAGSTTLGNNTTPTNRSTVPASAASVLVADTQARTNRGYGDSYVRSPNYATTTINETQDGTRLPATDASAVRAPSQFYARATGAQQVAQIPQQAFAGTSQPYYSGTFRTAQQVGAGSNSRLAANTNAVVLDQGTATYDPYGGTRSADWRNRDITSGNFQ